jgi:hypothetical protein
MTAQAVLEATSIGLRYPGDRASANRACCARYMAHPRVAIAFQDPSFSG